MTLDEANLILNVKREQPLEQVLKVRKPSTGSANNLQMYLELRASIQSQLTCSPTHTREGSQGESRPNVTFTLLAIEGCTRP